MVWLFNVSRETLRKWREKGLPYNSKKKKYPLRACLTWVKENIWHHQTEGGGINEEKLLRERARRKQDEFKADAMAKNLVPRDQAEKWLMGHVDEAKGALWGLPRRMGPTLAPVSDEKEVEFVLRKEIREILEELSAPLKKKK